MRAPPFTKYVRVDVVIECFPISDNTRRALLEAMPDAYGSGATNSELEDAWPEPDAPYDRPYMLARCWNRLPTPVQLDIVMAGSRKDAR